jgi:hypothetical protein
MTNRKKGFDPLSSLFDAPDSERVKQDESAPQGLTEPGRRIQVPDALRNEALDAGLELEDAPTEMAPMPETSLPVEQGEIAGAGPIKPKSSTEAVQFIGELPANDDWTESKPEALYSLNQVPKPDPDEEAAPRYGQRLSRVERLAARAVRPKNALEAARKAAKDETEEKVKVSRTLTDRIQELIVSSLPGIGTVSVQAAIVTDEREVLIALWKGHRSKFLADGQLERAVSSTRVLDSFKHAPNGALIAAHAVTDASDYLVWIDLQTGSLVAAFSDARAYFAG